MATEVQRIANRGSGPSALPVWVRSPMLLLALLFGLVGLAYLGGVPRTDELFAAYYLALAALVVVAAWAGTIAWIEVDPGRLRVAFNGRVRAIAMADIVDVEAHRHWHNPLAHGRAPPYWLKLRIARRRARVLPYVQPEAGNRLLLALHRLHKPILVFTWQ